MEIEEILKRRDIARVKDALAEVHREKAFSLADSEYIKEERERAARLHARHIALISLILPEVEVDPESITGLDYHLARAFRASVDKCTELSLPADDFYRYVVDELNRIVRSLCNSR
ncbi:hypothetical protein [Pyrobaculum aerophilum]|uniref:Uncharacterized protein n=1 Tax=Pyrobaculum aerophilum TaxID=13773 RepID=A0A371QWU8_9CREN|nr:MULTISPECIES: hypothetical protein [Pyrobaculum]MCX8135858.1 hypothetical protein [Pyrobaculum aerophilum]RFA94884.1 hypothetical protein CGL51_09080 [Pyrobaculum aerophilum]RFB00091.1 hypothetical protein CGL52_01715 [Pyrobaculum aerophilum]HII47127.1 hypothetical protein [Pyrobaculum aerophilum]